MWAGICVPFQEGARDDNQGPRLPAGGRSLPHGRPLFGGREVHSRWICEAAPLAEGSEVMMDLRSDNSICASGDAQSSQRPRARMEIPVPWICVTRSWTHAPLSRLKMAPLPGWRRCSTGDLCNGGVCEGGATSCDDGNVCTTDTCDPVWGCTHTPTSNPCEDGDQCTEFDFCIEGKCTMRRGILR